jgi:hypothetical protein
MRVGGVDVEVEDRDDCTGDGMLFEMETVWMKGRGCDREAKVVSRREGERVVLGVVLGIVRFQGVKRVGMSKSREVS